MSLSLSANNALATDINSLNSLKSQANANNPQAAREAAKQLESLFMHEMIKSMRQATMKSGLLDNDSSKLADSMMDQQLSVSMAGMPGGLADAITAQIARSMGIDPADAGVNPAAALSSGERNFSIPSTVSFAGRSARYPGLSGNSGVGSTAFWTHMRHRPRGVTTSSRPTAAPSPTAHREAETAKAHRG